MNSKVYILKEDLLSAKQAKSPTAYGRKLLDGVFTKYAIVTCSVGGNPATGKGKNLVEVRPALEEKGILAIIGEYFISYKYKI